MIFTETKLAGAYLIELKPIRDDRGFFARAYSEDEFIKRGLHHQFVQCNISFNAHRGTLRGMHFQQAPYGEVKLLRCTQGRIYDVIIDLRPDSQTYTHWFGIELSAENQRMLYIPQGFAHGFQTLEDNTELFYMMGEVYHPEAARGVRWDDPLFNIKWPITEGLILSEKDCQFEDYSR